MVNREIGAVGITEYISSKDAVWADFLDRFPFLITKGRYGFKSRDVVRIGAIVDGFRIDDILCYVNEGVLYVLDERASTLDRSYLQGIVIISQGIYNQCLKTGEGFCGSGNICDCYFDYNESL